MADTVLLPERSRGKIGGLVLDATISHNHAYTNMVTRYPVEEGADLTDFIRSEPEKLTMECLISDFPMERDFNNGVIPTTLSDKDSRSYDSYNTRLAVREVNMRSLSAFEQLCMYAGINYPERDAQGISVVSGKPLALPISVKAYPLTVVTGLRIYTNMVITDLQIPFNARTGHALRFSITFVKIRKVKLDAIMLVSAKNLNNKTPGIESQSSSTADKGAVPPITASKEDVDAFKKSGSLLFKIGNGKPYLEIAPH